MVYPWLFVNNCFFDKTSLNLSLPSTFWLLLMEIGATFRFLLGFSEVEVGKKRYSKDDSIRSSF